MVTRLFLVIAAALVARPSSVDACSCGQPRAFIYGGARDGKNTIPRNPQIRIGWWLGNVELDEPSIVLVPKGGVPGPVAVDRHAMTSEQIRVVTLVPKLPLAANAVYQVMAAEKSGMKPSVIGELTTSAAVDDKPPTWKGVSATTFIHAHAVCCNCSTGDPWVRFELAGELADDTTDANNLVFAVWKGDGAFDPKATPIAITGAWGGRVDLGHNSMCGPRDFSFPDGAKSLKLRIAPIDQAGNIGTPADVVVDLTHPLTKSPPR